METENMAFETNEEMSFNNMTAVIEKMTEELCSYMDDLGSPVLKRGSEKYADLICHIEEINKLIDKMIVNRAQLYVIPHYIRPDDEVAKEEEA